MEPSHHPGGGSARVTATLALALIVTACSGGSPDGGVSPGATSMTLYTSVTQDTVDAVLQAFAAVHPEITVNLFRAPTGEVDARIAAERRSGAIGADVLWGTDPLSTEQYDADGLLQAWDPPNAASVPEEYRQPHFWGTRILNVVIVAQRDLQPVPGDWGDLTDEAYRDGIALADPGFAGSVLGSMAYFALSDAYGRDYLRALADNGATEVQSIGDVINGVAEGQFQAGLSLDKSVRDAVDAGSPVQLIWPSSGAIAMYSPISIFSATRHPDAARTFVDFVLSSRAQEAIASTGWQPVRPDVAWDLTRGAQVQPDWSAAFAQREDLLREFRSIFGG